MSVPRLAVILGGRRAAAKMHVAFAPAILAFVGVDAVRAGCATGPTSAAPANKSPPDRPETERAQAPNHGDDDEHRL